jgi:hypothetical protein
MADHIALAGCRSDRHHTIPLSRKRLMTMDLFSNAAVDKVPPLRSSGEAAAELRRFVF